MNSAETIHRLQFAFTITYHYLFPQLTMGLALLIVVFKTVALRRRSEVAAEAARFWARIFGLSFVMGVVTGIPLEFQFGTNWSRFAAGAGATVGQLLAMEGVFAFFLESAFLYLLLFGESRLGPRGHWLVAVAVCAGTWLSGFFVVAASAWMQHPVGTEVARDGTVRLPGLGALLGNPWLPWQYLHTMLGSVVTASVVVAAIGALYQLLGRHPAHARLFLRVGVTAGAIAAALVAFPTGDQQAKMVATHQPATFAAMEGHFHTESGAGLVLIGQPDMERLALDNALVLPRALSFMTHQRWDASIRGLADFDRDLWPDNVPLLYYAYHIMVGLGTILLALLGAAALSLRRDRLLARRWLLWPLALALPLPFIANTAGWMTAELGRQPWLIHGILRTADGYSTRVSAGNALFTLLGFMGLYALLSLLYGTLALRILGRGPGRAAHPAAAE
jgi:cytochrome d ubiquinol oxidase subunit I